MSNLMINVEFLAGTDVKDAIEESVQLANKLDVAYVCFDFNGVKCSIGQSANVNETVKRVMSAMSKGEMKFVVAN